MLSRDYYPYAFLAIFAITAVLGLSLLRQALSRPSAAELAREMADLGAKAPVGGVIEAAVARGIAEALRPIAEEFRRDIREIDKRVAWLEGHHEASRWRPGMQDRRGRT